MAWFKLLDKSILNEQVEVWKKARAKRRSKEPYVLFGGIGTQTVAEGEMIQIPRLVILESRAGITSADVERFAYEKGHILLDYYFPTAADLKSLDNDRTNFESGWRLELRGNASFFNKAKDTCEKIVAEQDNQTIANKKVVQEKDREIEDLKKIIEKAERFKSEEKIDGKKDKKA